MSNFINMLHSIKSLYLICIYNVNDKKKLKEVAGSFPTGVTVVTIKKPSGDIHGMTASSFLSLSLSPPMILFSVKKENEILKYIEKGKIMGISILSEDMIDESNHFSNLKLMKETPVFVDEDKVKILKVQLLGTQFWLVKFTMKVIIK